MKCTWYGAMNPKPRGKFRNRKAHGGKIERVHPRGATKTSPTKISVANGFKLHPEIFRHQ